MKLSKLLIIAAIPFLLLNSEKKLIAQDNVKSNFGGSFNSVFVTKNIPFGYIAGKDPHQQNTLKFNYKNFNTFMWSGYDYGSQKTIENDYGVGYSKKVNDKLSFSGAYMYWSYLEKGFDNVANINLKHLGKLNKNLSYFHFFRKKTSAPAHAVGLNISKNLKASKFIVTPNVELNYIHNTFGGDKGFSRVSSGLDVKYSTKNFDVSGFCNAQLGFIGETKCGAYIDNALWGGLTFNTNF